MEALVMAGQLLLALTILVGLHEWGHLIAAKIFGMRVEKYSIGFPPKIWSKKIGETEYSFGSIPVGGFVKISGMVDESLDTKHLSKIPEPWEFRAKPAWQRLIVMMGGIIVNVMTGIVVFVCFAFANGDLYLTKEELNKHGIVAYELGEQIGFQTGDKILNINGREYERFADILSPDLLLGSDNYYVVLRENEEIKIPLPNDFVEELSTKEKGTSVIAPRTPFFVRSVVKNGNAAKAGIQKGDHFININGQPIVYFDQLNLMLDTLKSQTILAEIDREGKEMSIPILVNENGTLGFYADIDLNFTKKSFGFGEAISHGAYTAFTIVWQNIQGFRKIIKGEISAQKSLSGPIRIAKFFGGTWDWINLWKMVGLLSMAVAFINFLPIPALDGGHVVFLVWEMIVGKKPSDKVLETAQKVGMIIVLSLMVFVIVNDIIHF